MLGITRQSIHFWKRAGFVPARFANQVSSVTGVPVSELLPTGIKNEQTAPNGCKNNDT